MLNRISYHNKYMFLADHCGTFILHRASGKVGDWLAREDEEGERNQIMNYLYLFARSRGETVAFYYLLPYKSFLVVLLVIKIDKY